jgi:RNA polymerase sigma-70 factor (ECF subfamily)
MVSILKLRRYEQSAAFEALVNQHRASIYRVAYRLCGDRDDAEDLIQEALLEAYQAFGRFTSGTHFDRWVFRIMRNTYIDRVRSRPKARMDSLDDARTGALPREIVDLTNAPDLALMAQVLDGPIQEALQALPEEFRTVVILADIEDLSYEDISTTLSCPIGTVRSRLHRGRAILKDRLKSYARF